MKKLTTVLVIVLAFAFAVALAPSAEAAPPGPTIVDVAVAANSEGPYAGMFDTLIAAVSADPAVAGTLSGNGQFTVFAPTDDAFAALEAELGINLADLLGTPELRAILLYHVAHGNREAADVLSSDRIRTLNGGFLYQDSGTLTDMQGRTADIIVADVTLPANGVIHVINNVVLP
jgi:uncharacterized surface protein with fasciclin (FAS1) repeats